MSLDLQNLKDSKIDILKAEIGALLFNLGKTHIGIENWHYNFPNIDETCFEKNYNYGFFKGYRQYYSANVNGKSPIDIDMNKIDLVLKEFFDSPIKNISPDVPNIRKIVYGDSHNPPRFMKRIFFRGCENVNSGIDKGSPREKLCSLWIANAFGSFKEEVNENYFDKQRLYFLRNLANKLLQFHKNIEDSSVDEWVEIRNFILREIKLWYSHLLSDNRLPANDVTLWDQAYMTATLFKATISAIMLDYKRLKEYQDNPQFIRWRILGIQYDKLGLAEKGLKSTYINWYRDKAREVDDKIRILLETGYPLGNEIYGDETGIYFLVPENIAGEKDRDFYLLSGGLKNVQEKILAVFSSIFQGEVYPVILLTEASRGTMNIAHLIEKAKENFLKVIYPKNFENKLIHDNDANGICQVCGTRLARRKKDEEKALICDICEGRKESRISDWLNSINGETIWTGDLQDKNGRIALVTLKFELGEWLNGDLMSSTLIQQPTENYSDSLEKFKKLFTALKETFSDNLEEYNNFYSNNKGRINYLLSLFDEKGIKTPFDQIYKNIVSQYPQKSTKTNESTLNRIDLFERIFFEGLTKLNKTVEKNKKVQTIYDVAQKKLNLDNWKDKFRAVGGKNLVREIFAFFFIVHQIKAILLERSIGDNWEKSIKNKLGPKIDFDNRKINWKDLDDNDIDFLSQLLLQFLLRKNPSPARLRRIWETTENFFENIRENIKDLMDIEEWRCERLIWKNFVKDDNKRGKEYEYSDLDFWVDEKGNVYLTSSLRVAIDALSDSKNKLNKEEIKKQISEGRCDWLKEKISLKEYGNPDDKGFKLSLKDVTYANFLPYFSILDPTPISYQFIIPADTVPAFIKNVQDTYEKEFKWVIGKLPLHIGIVIQNYKKPLYMGIKALRNIRRDIGNWDKIKEPIKAKKLKAMQEEALPHRTTQKNLSKLENFYSLYQKEQGQGNYKFYLNPGKESVWVDTTKSANDNDSFIIYPNTVDFEFMDVNTRRNDIYYNEKGKRVKEEKKNRPYNWEDWQIFYDFKDYFKETEFTGKLQNIVSLIYSKLSDWKNDDESIKKFLFSTFINIFDLKDKNKDKQQKKLDKFAKLSGQSHWNKVKDLNSEEFKKVLWQFIDMFEFWHVYLKKI